jgi:DNA-binding NtrC family response regulator
MNSPHRILVVENLERIGRLLVLSLLALGYEVASMTDPQDVEAGLFNKPPELIVWASNIQVSEKVVLVNRWRQAAPGIKVLEVSARPYLPDASAQGLALGFPDLYVELPLDIDDLASAVEECLASP